MLFLSKIFNLILQQIISLYGVIFTYILIS